MSTLLSRTRCWQHRAAALFKITQESSLGQELKDLFRSSACRTKMLCVTVHLSVPMSYEYGNTSCSHTAVLLSSLHRGHGFKSMRENKKVTKCDFKGLTIAYTYTSLYLASGQWCYSGVLHGQNVSMGKTLLVHYTIIILFFTSTSSILKVFFRICLTLMNYDTMAHYESTSASTKGTQIF